MATYYEYQNENDFYDDGITSEAKTYCTAFLSTSRTPSSTGYKKDYKE